MIRPPSVSQSSASSGAKPMSSSKSPTAMPPSIIMVSSVSFFTSSLSAWRYSSSTWPTICSMMSVMVTMPAVPPCSSTTTAIFVEPSCSTCSSFATGMLSGTASMVRTGRSSIVEPFCIRYRSFTCTKPTMRSLVSRHTG